jgi:hypothetical protein
VGGYNGRVTPRVPRLLEALVAATVLFSLAVVAGGSAWVAAALEAPDSPAVARALDGQVGTGPAKISRKALAAVTWRGGPTTASTGEVVRVFVSDQLPLETPEKWAEFIAKLTHGPELATATTYIAIFDEVQDLCGAQALGCYGDNEIVSLGELALDGTTAEEVVRHEYGHHIAAYRQNTPWAAIDWGPKHWASSANVCARVANRQAFPGDGGRNYALNPGEAWAETYRLMDERKNGITTATWPIVSQTFFPNETALQAAERDVVQPWTKSTRSTFRRAFGKNVAKPWWIPVQTALDGDLKLNVTVPAGGRFDVAVVAPNRRTVLKRAQWVGQRSKRATATICGQRSLFVRVTPVAGGSPGRVTLSLTKP